MWTSSSDSSGFSVIELLLGLSLALCLVLGVAPLWTSSQSLAVREGDETVWTLQARVALARLEKDLRLAGAGGVAFPAGSAVLDASSSRLVLLVKTEGAPASLLVEWELVNGSLMRRWGPCPASLPGAFDHSLYVDNKTMLESIDLARSRLSYSVAGIAAVANGNTSSLPEIDLPLVDMVTLELHSRLPGVAAQAQAVASRGVGR